MELFSYALNVNLLRGTGCTTFRGAQLPVRTVEKWSTKKNGKCKGMIRHLIGKSLSTCTKDILDGTIDEGEVLLICTSTKHPFNDPNHFYDMRYFDSTKEAELLQRLWKQGRIHQPRMLSDSYNYGKEGPLFPYDNYRHQSWFSIIDQALTDIDYVPLEEAVETILLGPDYNDGADYHLQKKESSE